MTQTFLNAASSSSALCFPQQVPLYNSQIRDELYLEGTCVVDCEASTELPGTCDSDILLKTAKLFYCSEFEDLWQEKVIFYTKIFASFPASSYSNIRISTFFLR